MILQGEKNQNQNLEETKQQQKIPQNPTPESGGAEKDVYL